MGYFTRIIYYNPVTLWGEHAGVTPSHLIRICSFIEKHYDIEQIIIDGQEAFGIPINIKGYFDVIKLACEKISKLIDENTILAFSLTSAQDIVSVIPLIEELKIKNKIHTIAGGYGVSTCYELLLKSFPNLFECIIIGPGEFPLLELIKKSNKGILQPEGITGCAYLKNKEVYYLQSNFISPENVDFNWNFLDNKTFYTCLATSSSQYCNNKCRFCVEPSMNSMLTTVTPKIYENNLIKSLESFPHIKYLWITDPHIGGTLKNGINILKIVTDYSLKAFINLRCDFDTSKLLNKEKFKDFVFYFGLESANPETLIRMGKTKNPNKYLYSFKQNIEFCLKYDVLRTIGLIINYPYESFFETRKTINYLSNNLPKNEFNNNGIVFSASLFMIHYGDLFYKKITQLIDDGLMFESPFFEIKYNVPEELELVTKKCSKDFDFPKALSAIEEVQHMSIINNNTMERLTSFGYFDRHNIKNKIKADVIDLNLLRTISMNINYK